MRHIGDIGGHILPIRVELDMKRIYLSTSTCLSTTYIIDECIHPVLEVCRVEIGSRGRDRQLSALAEPLRGEGTRLTAADGSW
jgi:hypothetical protein